jgi:peptide/nickel transport system permease protein
MPVYFLRQALLAIPALVGVILIAFILMRAVPGDVVTNLVGVEGDVSPERIAEMRFWRINI